MAMSTEGQDFLMCEGSHENWEVWCKKIPGALFTVCTYL